MKVSKKIFRELAELTEGYFFFSGLHVSTGLEAKILVFFKHDQKIVRPLVHFKNRKSKNVVMFINGHSPSHLPQSGDSSG
jgi:hypothetical protein